MGLPMTIKRKRKITTAELLRRRLADRTAELAVATDRAATLEDEIDAVSRQLVEEWKRLEAAERTISYMGDMAAASRGDKQGEARCRAAWPDRQAQPHDEFAEAVKRLVHGDREDLGRKR